VACVYKHKDGYVCWIEIARLPKIVLPPQRTRPRPSSIFWEKPFSRKSKNRQSGCARQLLSSIIMWVDGVPRLSLMSKSQTAANTNTNSSNISISTSTATNTNRISTLRLRWSKNNNRSKNPNKIKKKRVRFAMSSNTTHRIPMPRNKESSWYTPYDYSFFILNWKYRRNEPMESRHFMDVLWQVKDTPESERTEDYQSFLPGAHVRRQKIRKALLLNYDHDKKHDHLAPISLSLSLKHRQQAHKCATLCAKEVLQDSPSPRVVIIRQEESSDPTSVISEYVDSIFHDWNPMNLWSGSSCQPSKD
jgi:hypothetical protein